VAVTPERYGDRMTDDYLTDDPFADPFENLDDDPFHLDADDYDGDTISAEEEEVLGFLAGDYASDAHLLGFGPF
jgi:hypothetical protein